MSSSPTRCSHHDLVEVTLPDLGEEVVTVVAWSKEPGDDVATEEPLCLIAVGPAHAEVGSPADGILAAIAVPAGSVVTSGAALAEIATAVAEPEPEVERIPEPEPEPEPIAEPEPEPSPEPEPERELPQPEPVALEAPPPRNVTVAEFRSPAVLRLADILGIDLGHVEPSGRDGRVTRDDVLAHVEAGGDRPAEAVSSSTG